MTTLAAMLGALPMLLGSGNGLRTAPAARPRDHRRSRLSQILTLFTSPVIYLAFDRLAGVSAAGRAPPGRDGPRRRLT